MKKKFALVAVLTIAVGVLSPMNIVHAVAGSWSSSGSVIYYNDGNVGLGTNAPLAPLHIVNSSGIGKLLIGKQRGSWDFMANASSDGNGYNNMSNNAYYDDSTGWNRRETNKDSWFFGNYTTSNNSGTFNIQHVNAESSTAITTGNIKTFFQINSIGDTRIDGRLAVKEVYVKTNVWADYVFNPSYKLMPLPELEKFLNQNKHLPNIPSAKEIEGNEMSLGEMQRLQMEKIEELTLYAIQQDKKISDLEDRLEKLEKLLGV